MKERIEEKIEKYFKENVLDLKPTKNASTTTYKVYLGKEVVGFIEYIGKDSSKRKDIKEGPWSVKIQPEKRSKELGNVKDRKFETKKNLNEALMMIKEYLEEYGIEVIGPERRK